MKMYRCCDCGHKFDYPKVVQEMLAYYGDVPYYEPFAYCPHCDSDDFEEWYDDKVHTADGQFIPEQGFLHNPITGNVYQVEDIDDEDVNVVEVLCDDTGDLRKEHGQYVYGIRDTFTRQLIQDIMEGL